MRQEVLQRSRLRERQPSHMFFFGGGRPLVPCQTKITASSQKSAEDPPTFCTADPRETTFLYQFISVAIQRFNAVCLCQHVHSSS